MRRAVVIGLLVGWSVAAPVFAHDEAPQHDCVAPQRPADKNDPAVWNPFVDQVNAYRACMNAFIESSHAAAERHRAAANRATEEWNGFVRGSLNVPDVYPWPPPG